MKTGRNEPCPCGSGKKHKHCCGEHSSRAATSGRAGIVIGTLVVLIAIAVIVSKRNEAGADATASVQPAKTASTGVAPLALPPASTAPPTQAAPIGTPGAQPPGPAPEGKLWSPEHGHWHDKPQVNPWVNVEPVRSSGAKMIDGKPLFPQPNTPVPPGMVWSPQHGHWHDAKTGLQPKREIPPEVAAQMRTPGIPDLAKNTVWSEEHQHWHKADGGDGTHEKALTAGPQTAATSTTPAATTTVTTDPH